MKTIIDPPPPFATLDDWRKFLTDMESAARSDPGNADFGPFIREAREMVAKLEG